MSTHFQKMMEKHSKDYSIWVQEGDKVEKHSDCRLIHMDESGVTFLDKTKLGKNKVTFIPMFKLIRIQQEFI